MKEMLLLRGYYGVNIHSDAHGDLGVFEYSVNRFADLIFLTAATIADEAKDINLHVLEANADKVLPDDLMSQLKDNYDYIILRTSAAVVQLDLELAKRLKKKYPNAQLILVGHVAKLLKNWIHENEKEVDLVVEKPLDIFMYQFIHNTDADVDINDFPSPNYELLSYENFRDYDGGLRLSLQTSRGCIMQCGYCPYNAFYGCKIAYRDTDKVIDDIKNVLKLNPTSIQFRDQYFTANKAKVKELCNRIIEEGLEFEWSCETRLDNVDKELADIMINAGMRMICFGVESGSDDILSEFGRQNVNYAKMKELVAYMNSKGVKTLAFYIVGFPQDTWESAQKTFEKSLDLNTTYAKFSAYEPCVFGENNEVGMEIVPDLFKPYQNAMNIEAGEGMSHAEASYLVDFFSLIYAFKNDCLKSSYSVVYTEQSAYKKLLNDLSVFGTDLDKVCAFLKEHSSEYSYK